MTLHMIPHSKPWITKEDRKAVEQVLVSSQIACGELVSVFEDQFSRYLGVKRAFACSNGTAALLIVLKAMGIGAGDCVIVPTYVCNSVLSAIRAAGASPEICDVNAEGVLTLHTVLARVHHRVAAIIAVHIMGRPCNVEELQSLGIPVIEDVCQAFGLTIAGRKAGTIGTAAVYSFHATKCLTTGEGGMVTCNDDFLLEKLLFERGNSFSFMTDLQASLGIAQLSRYPMFILRRCHLWHRFADEEENFTGASIHKGNKDFPFRLTFVSSKPFAEVRQNFLQYGVHVRRGVDQLLHRIAELDDREYPVAKSVFDKTVSVPFYPALKDSEVDRIIEALKVVFREA